MKKILCSIVIICGLQTFVNAQEFRFGLTASPEFCWFGIHGDDIQSDGPRLGFQYGLLFEPTIGSVERYAFSTGIIVNVAGGNISDVDTSLNLEFISNIKAQYIEVPITIKLRTNEVNYMTYYGLFGMTPGINIQARDHIEDGDGNVIAEDLDIRDQTGTENYKLFNVSLTLGAGVEYAMTENTSLTGGIFFQNGFTNVFETSATEENIQLKQFGIRLGVLF
jgi:hypothetical protein